MTIAEKRKHYRISESEHKKMIELLDREPKDIEWALFSALWSEHCSYKSSRIHLKKFGKTHNETVVSAHGENAGIIDLGAGERIAFKMESHNHPSFIEPYQGAATGVGGILRDIFTMGARPIAIADYLCFGDVTESHMPRLMDGVVRGISGYGNCVGVPTVTGQTNFDSSYNQNILVNAMAVGLFREGEPVALSGAKGIGNLVVYVGAKTGKDGVHGASMASESFDTDSESKRPNVQIGDPYFEKLLIESCLSVIRENLVVSIQDMGAAGLTSSSFEMASKGQVGMRLDLDQVPLRDSSITPEEILLSESQERMLLICEPAKLEVLQKHFEKWGLDAVVVGQVIKERKVILKWKNEVLTEIDPDLLVENAPMYERKFKGWDFPNKKEKVSAFNINLQEQMASVYFASRKPIYRQYDQRVGASTASGAESDVAMIMLADSKRGLAITVGCRPHWMKADAKIGAYDSVFYPALQMAIKGAKALAITDCLNFGNPEREQIMSEFVASVDAITEASILLNAPVISGNVSFYNEYSGGEKPLNITSTPATGLVGIRPNVQSIPKDMFDRPGLKVFKVSMVKASKGVEDSWMGTWNNETPKEIAQMISKLLNFKNFSVSQMVSQGGLAVSLAKMCLGGIGFKATRDFSTEDFGIENIYEVIFATEQAAEFLKSTEGCNLQVEEIGVTGGTELMLGKNLQCSIEEYKSANLTGLSPFFTGVNL
jgi:phosphoribosylformylglycinamidine synthase subunit PurL